MNEAGTILLGLVVAMLSTVVLPIILVAKFEDDPSTTDHTISRDTPASNAEQMDIPEAMHYWSGWNTYYRPYFSGYTGKYHP